MKLRSLLPLLAVTALPGCYRYAPVSLDAVAPGESVRARLTLDADAALPPTVRGTDRSVEGELLDRDRDGVTLFVSSSTVQTGFFAERLHERVVLRPSDVVELERRQLDRARTFTLAAAAAVVVAAVATETLTGKTGGDTRQPPDGGTSAAVLPALRVSVPIP